VIFMWFVGVLGVIAGIMQAAGVGWWGLHPLVMWPVLLIAITLPFKDKRWIVAAVLGGLAWDSITGIIGPATLSLLIGGELAQVAEQRWLPARGGIAGGILAIGMALVVHVLLFVLAGFSEPGVPVNWWLVEAIGTGVVVALFYRLVASFYGHRSI
jgi:hypothetical protein